MSKNDNTIDLILSREKAAPSRGKTGPFAILRVYLVVYLSGHLFRNSSSE